MPQYLRKKETGEVFLRTDLLARRADMEPAPAPEAAPDRREGAKTPLHAMSRADLVTYARARFGLDLNPRKSTAEFRARIAVRERAPGAGGRS